MSKIPNWSPLDESEYDERQFVKIWRHDRKDRRMVVKRKARTNTMEYDVYVLGDETNYIRRDHNNQEEALSIAKRWMRNHPMNGGKKTQVEVRDVSDGYDVVVDGQVRENLDSSKAANRLAVSLGEQHEPAKVSLS